MRFDPTLFFSTYALIFLAELPDKTAFATLIMATRNSPWAIFVGVALAFLVQTGVAVCFGRAFALLPEHAVHVASGLLFLAFGAWAWLKKGDEEEGEAAARGEGLGGFARTVLSSFAVIFIAEWGDLTQLATATLVAKLPGELPTIFTATVLGLWSATALTILVGNRARRWIRPGPLKKIAAVAFAGVGAFILWRG